MPLQLEIITISQVFAGEAAWDVQNAHCLKMPFVACDGRLYLVKGRNAGVGGPNAGTHTEYYGLLDDGTFGIVLSCEQSLSQSGVASTKINGVEADEAEAREMLGRWDSESAEEVYLCVPSSSDRNTNDAANSTRDTITMLSDIMYGSSESETGDGVSEIRADNSPAEESFPSLDLSDADTYQSLNRYLSGFGMTVELGR